MTEAERLFKKLRNETQQLLDHSFAALEADQMGDDEQCQSQHHLAKLYLKDAKETLRRLGKSYEPTYSTESESPTQPPASSGTANQAAGESTESFRLLAS